MTSSYIQILCLSGLMSLMHMASVAKFSAHGALDLGRTGCRVLGVKGRL